jgi:hypothetical protein
MVSDLLGEEDGTKGYYKGIYENLKAGDTARAAELAEYLTKGKGIEEKDITTKMGSLAKEDETLSEAERAEFMAEQGVSSTAKYIREQLKAGTITAEDARKLLKKAEPEKTDEQVWWSVDRIQYQLETGAEEAPDGNEYYYRLIDAVDENSTEKIRTAIRGLLEHGVKQENIVKKLSAWKSKYLEGNADTKRRIRDALQKAYRELGLTAEDADKKIDSWKK